MSDCADVTKCVDEVLTRLRVDYYIVHKDDWRAYTVRTLVALILVGGVTLAAVLTVIWGGTNAAIVREMNNLKNEAQVAASEIEAFNQKLVAGAAPLAVSELKVRRDGKDKIVLRADADGPQMVMYDAAGREKLRLLVDGQQPKLMLFDKSAKRPALVLAGDDDGGRVEIASAGGAPWFEVLGGDVRVLATSLKPILPK